MWNLVFLFTGIIFIILLLVIFLSKPKLKTKENRMFLILSILNLIGYIIEIALQILVRQVGNGLVFGIELSKVYIMYIFVWFSIFSIYTFLISNSSGKLSDYSYKMIKYTHITAAVLGVIGIGLMPIEKYYANGEMYTYGMAVNFLKVMLGVYIFIWIIRLLCNFKTIKEKKYYSIIITILLLFANIVVQSINPTILIATFTMTYTCYIIFFTIENPDIRMAKDLAFANEQLKSKKDNTLEVLNTLSNRLQNSLSKLETFAYKKTDTKNTEEMKKDLRYIKKYCINFVDKFNGLIDISKITSGNLTINEDEYETNNLIEEIKNITSKDMIIRKDKLPRVLYGDKDMIKQVVILIYNYLSSKGNIDIKLDYVTAGNLCKLKFNFITKDIDISDYICKTKEYAVKDNSFTFYENKDNIEYDKIMSLISLLELDTDIIRHNNENKLILSINQKIRSPYKILEEKENNRNIKVRYFDLSNKRILLLDDSTKDIREMLLLLAPYKVKVDVAKDFYDFKNYLNSNKTYDLIFVDDIIYNAKDRKFSIELYGKLTGYDSFKSIIMLPYDKEEDINKYLTEGYTDYIIKPLNKKNVNEILKKYLKR